MKQAYKYCNDLYALSQMQRKMKKPQRSSLTFPDFFLISHSGYLLSKPLNSFSVNALNQLPWQPRYTICSFTQTTLNYLTTVDVSLSLCFPSPPVFSAWQEWLSYTEERRGAEVLPSPSWAPVQALGGARCEMHTSQQWQPGCSYGSVRQCLQTVHGPFTAPALQKLPPELCVQDLIQHAKSVCRSPDSSCLPNTLNLFSDITLSGDVRFLKSVSARVQVYWHSNSHIKKRRQNRCAEDEKPEKAEKNLSTEVGPAV